MTFEITKTELVWPGKYDEKGKRREPPRVSLPFQVIERVNESRATREAEKRRDLTLFDVWKGDEGETFEEGWRNKLIWGDNLLVMSSLLDQFAGKINLIYIDPPFATGSDFSFSVEVGDGSVELRKAPSPIEDKAYSDTWGRSLDSYLSMMAPRLEVMRALLADRGSIVVHLDSHVGSHVRLLLDEIFGRSNFRNEIIWFYKGGALTGVQRALPKKHDNLFWYSKSDAYHFRQIRQEDVSEQMLRRWGAYANERGEVEFGKIRHEGDTHERLRRRYKKEHGTEPPDSAVAFVMQPSLVRSVWDDIPEVRNSPRYVESVGFETQKPLRLAERVIEMLSEPGDFVADFFCGSGTTLVAAESMNRRWLGSDLGRYAVHLSRKRLLDIADCRSFEVLNLGKYERQYWQVATFGEDLDADGSIALYEYVAFILKLYGATAVSGMGNLHGKIGRAFVHVGAVDSPVTIQEIAEAIEECKAVRGTELHVLGWEWEMGVNDLMVEQAKQEGIKLLLRQIPREVMEEQAAAKGDVRFFELAYMDFEVKPGRGKREFRVELKDFAIPNPELVPDDVRSKIKKWSDYVDYWAVDWDFRDDTFMQGWVTYRTRKDRSLELKSDPHIYEEPGEYAVMVKVIDIFGNDTSKIARIKVT